MQDTRPQRSGCFEKSEGRTIASNIIVIPEGKICDYIDGKFRNDTPEECVRQSVEKCLVNEYGYSTERIAVEFTIQVGSHKPRADLVVFHGDKSERTQENVYIIIECKKESINPTHKKDGVRQLKSYMAACPNCEWGLWTNGKQKEVFRKVVSEQGKIEFHEYSDIPLTNGFVGVYVKELRQILQPKMKKLLTWDECSLFFRLLFYLDRETNIVLSPGQCFGGLEGKLKGAAFPASIKEIIEISGRSKRTVLNVLASLEKKGLIGKVTLPGRGARRKAIFLNPRFVFKGGLNHFVSGRREERSQEVISDGKTEGSE